MVKHYELSIVIRAQRERVFDSFSDPEIAFKAAGNTYKIQELSRMPVAEGTEWTVKYPFINGRNTKCRIIAYERPHRLITELSGNVIATVEDLFESIPSGTMVYRKLAVRRVGLPLISTDVFRRKQQVFLENMKVHIEGEASMHSSVNEKGRHEHEGKAKISFVVSPSVLIKRRKQLTVRSELLIAASMESVFDVVIRHPDRFWEWMVGDPSRSNPNFQLEVSPNWPEVGSFYRFKTRSKVPFTRWETGIVRILESKPLEHVLMRQEIQELGEILLTDWKLEQIAYGTRLLIQYDLVTSNLILNFMLSRLPESIVDGFRKEGAEIIQVCERRARHSA